MHRPARSSFSRLPACRKLCAGLALATLSLVAPAARAAPEASRESSEAGAALELRCDACFVDVEGHVVPFEPAYAAWFAGKRAEPRYWMAAAEMAIVLAAGTAYYWIRPSINRQDWDFPDALTRLGNLEVTFDNNEFPTNHVLHPAAGATYYLFARENDLNPWVSLGYSAASSAVFEFFLEWLEKVSINDLIFTPAAGAPAGEFVFQLSEYLNSAPRRTLGTDIAAYSLGAASAIHGRPRAADGPERLPPDNLGLSSAFWHRFRVAYGVGRSFTERDEAETFHRITLEGEINAMPGMLRPGRFATDFGQANFNQMRLRYGLSGRGMTEADIWFRTVMAGYYAQSFERPADALTGQAGLIGLGMAWRFYDRVPLGRRDQFAMAHLLGPVAKSWLALGGAMLETEADAHLDFGGVRSLPFPDYVEVIGEDGMKSVLRNYGYAFVSGGSARISGALSYAGVELGARRSYGYYSSIEGYDRLQSEVQNDTPSRDEVSEIEAWAAAKAPELPIELRLDYHRIFRRSRLTPFREYRTDRTIVASLGARF